MHTVVVAGFPGVGKSFLAKNCKESVCDLNITDFCGLPIKEIIQDKNNIIDYINFFKEQLGKVEYIFISALPQVLKELTKNNIDYTIVYPRKKTSKSYLEVNRINNYSDIDIAYIKDSYDKWLDYIKDYKNKKVSLFSEQVYLSDVIFDIKRTTYNNLCIKLYRKYKGEDWLYNFLVNYSLQYPYQRIGQLISNYIENEIDDTDQLKYIDTLFKNKYIFEEEPWETYKYWKLVFKYPPIYLDVEYTKEVSDTILIDIPKLYNIVEKEYLEKTENKQVSKDIFYYFLNNFERFLIKTINDNVIDCEFGWKINKIIKNFYRYLVVEILKE